jgi:hypothetical protein
MPEPFMEHPSGDFETGIEAMEDAIRRLRLLPCWDQWITFCAQGEGHTQDSIQFAEVRILGDRLDVGPKPLDLPQIMNAAGVAVSSIIEDGPYYLITTASAKQVALILNAIFRHHFGIFPFPDEGDDYAVGAEW